NAMSKKDIGDYGIMYGPNTPPKDMWKELAKPLDREWAFAVDYRERLDAVCPGEWDVTYEALGTHDHEHLFKCRVQILGVIREGVGADRNIELAQLSAFAAACQMFGMGQQAAP